MNLVALRDAVTKKLADEFDPRISVQTHGGRFDAAELKRWALKAPCVLVAILGLPRLELEGGTWTADIRWSAFILAKDLPQRPRDASALDLIEMVLKVIRPEESWGDPDGQAVREAAAENLYSGPIDSIGVALWALTWRQRHDLAVPVEGFADFITCDTQYSVVGGSTDSAPQLESVIALPTGVP